MQAKDQKRTKILQSYYVNAGEIKRLLNISGESARVLFHVVDEEERQRKYRAHMNKVPLKRVLELAGIDYAFLLKQCKEEEEEARRWQTH